MASDAAWFDGRRCPGKVRITSDGTIGGTRIVVFDSELREVELTGTMRLEVDAETDAVRAVITVRAPELDIIADKEVRDA